MTERMRAALEGLSVGDAFGEQFFGPPGIVLERIAERTAPAAAVWQWTDDTAMALAIALVLDAHGKVDRDALATAFADRYRADPMRGYGGTAHGILQAIGAGVPWAVAAGRVFDGQGSMGNGGAMRAAPIGAYFAGDLERTIAEARASAEPTHAHPDGQAGAIAVAVAAAIACRRPLVAGAALLEEVVFHTPPGATRDGLAKALALPLTYDPRTAAAALGTGARVISSDTVPFALWCAARHLDSYEEAMWTTVSGLGDRDTTCAIAGGVVACAVGVEGIPATWRARREPLPR
ncbi:MAG: ADP-ribosylglycohydrolase family protein [Labilithrix sp.]|nr:ADP-ribosylglycohydrolase family protein [Labilithrix sp.]MCW5813292.1 ADP-ribosylglycohydrolase family protein [Labilithrix sp.]